MCKVQIKNSKESENLYVYTPYNADFVKAVKRINGTWSAADRAWIVTPKMKEQLKKLLLEYYGETGEEQKRTYKITATRKFWECRASVTAGGLVIASAMNRDSGAKVGEGVYMLEGEIDSGGSAKYWGTEVEEDSVFQVEMTEVQARRAATEGWAVEAMTTETTKKDEIIEQLNSAMGVINAAKDDNMAEAIANMENLLKALKEEIF
jgi:hypothetical protein